MALGGIGAVIILLVWGIIATLPKKEDGREGEVRLRSEIKDNFTLKDMLRSVEKEMENRRENSMPGGGNYGMDEPEDTVSPESEIQRIRELIRHNEQTLGSGPLSGTEQPAPSPFREKEATDDEEEKPRKTEPEDTVPEETYSTMLLSAILMTHRVKIMGNLSVKYMLTLTSSSVMSIFI